MPAAARLGDNTAHGTPLGPGLGSPNVLVGGRPAWRCLIDEHVCPLSESAKAHVGGKVQKGSSKVFINGYPAAVQGNVIVEIGVSNSIIEGCGKVQIGG